MCPSDFAAGTTSRTQSHWCTHMRGSEYVCILLVSHHVCILPNVRASTPHVHTAQCMCKHTKHACQQAHVCNNLSRSVRHASVTYMLDFFQLCIHPWQHMPCELLGSNSTATGQGVRHAMVPTLHADCPCRNVIQVGHHSMLPRPKPQGQRIFLLTPASQHLCVWSCTATQNLRKCGAVPDSFEAMKAIHTH